MIRFGQSGDWHVTKGERMADTLACIDFLIDDGIAQGVTAWAFFGDFSGTTVPHRMLTEERNAIWPRLVRAASVGPVIVGYGNHDYLGDLDEWASLEAAHPIVVVDRPQILDLAGARFFCLPYPDKRIWAAPYLDRSLEAQDAAVEDALRTLLRSWEPAVRAARAQGTPTIFLHHAVVRDCAVAGGETIRPGQEVMLAVGDIAALGCDYSGGQHIHLGQEMARGIWFAGSPSRSNFGETDEKGYLIVDVEAGQSPQVHRRLTPARRLVTATVGWDAERNALAYDADLIAAAGAAGAEVKLRVALPESVAATADVDALVDRVRAAGAVDVTIAQRTIPVQRVRSETVLQATGVEGQLAAFWDSLNGTGPDAEQRARCLAKLTRLQHREAA